MLSQKNDPAFQKKRQLDTSLCPRQLALQVLQIQNARHKSQAALSLARISTRSTAWQLNHVYAEPDGIPGMPSNLVLVHAKAIKILPLNTTAGRGAMLHALAHIEFNAINLALDAVWRFPNMPLAYYQQWLRVAREEAYHFRMLVRRLATTGTQYADLPAHNTLWIMADKTKHSLIARMALVPRLYEARGLDAAPAVKQKLQSAGDLASAAVIAVIQRDEIGHVAIGNTWYNLLCKQAGLDPITHYHTLCKQYQATPLQPPFNLEARRAAGFTEAELLALCQG